MLGDEDDKRIKEAADHYHPEYDDSAWEKMLQLLDLHLPVEEERKRNFFFTLLLLSVGCVVLLIGVYYWQNNKSEATLNLLSTHQTEKINVSNGTSDSKNITQQPSAEIKNTTAIRKEKIAIENHTENLEAKNLGKTKTVSSFLNSNNKKIVGEFDNDLSSKQNDELKQKGIETINSKNINQPERTASENAAIETTLTAVNNKEDIEKSSEQKERILQHDVEKKEKII